MRSEYLVLIDDDGSDDIEAVISSQNHSFPFPRFCVVFPVNDIGIPNKSIIQCALQ